MESDCFKFGEVSDIRRYLRMAAVKLAETIKESLWQHGRKEFLASGEQLTKLGLLVIFKRTESLCSVKPF